MKNYYTAEKNVLVLVSLLKAKGIRYIVASPGTTNITFVASLQYDKFFKIFSAYDERSAAYIALGISMATNEPVVLSCTGATASRNYLSGLNESFQQKYPILAVTSSQALSSIGQGIPQVTDRRSTFGDSAAASFQIPGITDSYSIDSATTDINQALQLLAARKQPVHINLITQYSQDFSVKALPNIRKIDLITKSDEKFPNISQSKIGIFIGSHGLFSESQTKIIESFCNKYDAVVFGDHTSNYSGQHFILANLITSQINSLDLFKFDLVINIGNISGAYIGFEAKEIWRVSEDGNPSDRYRKDTKIFKMSEDCFFEHYTAGSKEHPRFDLYNKISKADKSLRSKIPSEMPFSNIGIARKLSTLLPTNSILHLGILNSLRSWNYFPINKTIFSYSNTGGFGIDGCLSSAIGTAISNPKKEVFCILGDLAFFYDTDGLFTHSIKPNLHVLIINNGLGTEFKNYNHKAAIFGEEANKYIAAAGHNISKSGSIIKDLANSLGFEYFDAKDWESFSNKIELFLKPSGKPVLFEVNTSDKNESLALRKMNTINGVPTLKSRIKSKLIKVKNLLAFKFRSN